MAIDAIGGTVALPIEEAPTSWSMFLWRIRRNTKAMIGGTIVVALLVIIVFAPLLAPHGPLDGNPTAARQVLARALPLLPDGLRAKRLAPVRIDRLPGTEAP